MTEEELLTQFPELARVEKRNPGSWRQVKSFVLRGQRLKDYQINAVKEHLHNYAVFFSDSPFDWRALFGNDNPVVIEIGFGMGEATLRLAQDNPGINYLALEVFLYGFTKLLAGAAATEVGGGVSGGVSNLRLMRFDARDVLESMVPDSSVSGFHIFFPDPWPKKRHHRRRLIQADFAALLKSKLVAGGYVFCATDWEEYALQMLDVFDAAGFENPSQGFSEPVKWRPSTGFERKGLEQNHSIFEVFVKKPDVPLPLCDNLMF